MTDSAERAFSVGVDGKVAYGAEKSEAYPYASNYVVTSRYTWYSFLPLNLMVPLLMTMQNIQPTYPLPRLSH